MKAVGWLVALVLGVPAYAGAAGLDWWQPYAAIDWAIRHG